MEPKIMRPQAPLRMFSMTFRPEVLLRNIYEWKYPYIVIPVIARPTKRMRIAPKLENPFMHAIISGGLNKNDIK
jgi:hypothetical protein